MSAAASGTSASIGSLAAVIPDRQVSFREIEDIVGNGLTRARVTLWELGKLLDLLVDLDLAANQEFHRIAAKVARRCTAEIDETMRRLRALGP